MKLLLLSIYLLISSYSQAQYDTTSNLTSEEKVYGLSMFWKEASYNFVYFKKTGINWDSAYQAFIPKVLETKSTYAYYRTLQKFAALLKDGHTSISFPPSLQKGDINSDITFIYLNGAVYNTTIPKKDVALIPLGSKLVKINNRETFEVLQNEIFPYIFYSAPHQLYNFGVSNIVSRLASDNKDVKLTFSKPSGELVEYFTRTNTGSKGYAMAPSIFTHTNFFTLLPGDIGYLQLMTFRDSSSIYELQKHLAALSQCKGIVIDIRRNSGGNSGIAAHFLKYFTTQKIIGGPAWRTLNHLAAYKAWGQFYTLNDTIGVDRNEKEFIKKTVAVANNNYWTAEESDTFMNNVKALRIKAPVIVLTDNNTGSAAEDFLVSLSTIKGRAITVGERTMGSTGQPLLFNLPGGGLAKICTRTVTFPGGKEFVGYGIKPDVEIHPTINDILAGRDVILEKGISILQDYLPKK
jgi:carboxyl-terminal processing protease